MRKVKPQDEVPIWFIEPRYYEKRVARMKDAGVKRNVLREMDKLRVYIESLKGKDVDTEVLLQRIYKVADLYMAETLADKVACAKGCAYCCTRIQVEATCLEVDYLVQHTNDLVLNLWTKRSLKKGDPVDGPCPVLNTETGLCSAYEHRPLQCRMFATLDSYDYCVDPNSSHYIHTPNSHVFWKWVLGVIALMSHQAAVQGKATAVADMREWFTKVEK